MKPRNIRMGEKLWDRAGEIADVVGTNRSDFIREALEQRIKRLERQDALADEIAARSAATADFFRDAGETQREAMNMLAETLDLLSEYFNQGGDAPNVRSTDPG